MRFRNPDWLAELQGVVVVALVVLAGIIAFNVVTLADGGPVTARVPADAVAGVADATAGLRAGVVVDGDVEVRVADPTPGQLVAYHLTVLPMLAVAAAVLVLLWTVLRRARRGDPFATGTVRRLRRIGWVALVGGVLAQLVQLIASLELTARVTADGEQSATLDLTRTGLLLLLGFGFFAIAEIVKRGLTMRTELETVI
ncbi:DUF2975 domain-containing protein [Micromonospora sp. NBC_01796]|uniref:DUF2975 domain-containing protein n=1 Tax=Micromonospora sp. NBC_01796 TaxID=2975987 RepID=UPI002DDC1B15|nr:DUF2975 domain-containing protein [Micromonospora sp. NBC_01796]WSA85388.1 DUF2975 domain-containing protein [Micromonospora sp. NBC_01796]